MIRRIAVLAVVAGMLVGSAAFADLSLGTTYDMTINEKLTGYSGDINQFSDNNGTLELYGGGNVYWCLPKITVTKVTGGPTITPVTLYGVCIDTNEYTGVPMTLKQGWGDPLALPPVLPPPLQQGDNAARLNGTVKDLAAWQHTTYLFSKYGGQLETWWSSNAAADQQKSAAFQLAIWEVMSGDGSASGGNWGTGQGQFTAPGIGTLQTTANDLVKEAFDSGFSTSWASNAYYLHDHQDFLVYVPGGTNSDPVVPEIPAVALGPLGLMALGLLKRRFVK